MDETSSKPGTIARKGRNYWRVAAADRFAFLIDASAYFEVLADALESARRSVYILGWDVHSRVRLRRDAPDERSELVALLDTIARRRKDLHIHVLTWDFAMIFAMEREMLPVYRFDWRTHGRVHVELDGHHPLGACHHQKIVVIDDRLAFTGGVDVTMRRWDTPAHRPGDPRRTDPYGTAYGPFHDVHCAFDGAAAAALGDLARDRWKWATGRTLPPGEGPDPVWPGRLEPDVTGIDVAIARTLPGFDGREEVREIETMYRDAIASARRFVYVENQYLSSNAIGEALEASLRKAEGPEIVIVLPRDAAGWLEANTVGVLRTRLLETLRRVDRGDRLRVRYPAQRNLGGATVRVHSKVCVVDDEFVTVGSANLSNRSMGLDTECNVFIEAAGEARTRAAIGAFRNRLLGEHLGVAPEDVAAAFDRHGSLVRAIDDLGGGDRSLEPLEDTASDWAGALVADPGLVDPERPIDPTELVHRFFSGRTETSEPSSRFGPLLAVAIVVALAAAWRWTPLGDWATAERVSDWIEAYRSSSLALPATIALYVVAGFAVVPLTALIVPTALVFGPLPAVLHAMSGSLASAAATYAAGQLFGRRFASEGAAGGVLARSFERIKRLVENQGVVHLALIRLLPIAPYSIVNLVAGACGVRFWPFMAGTLIGLTPGILALTVLGGQVARLLRDPSGGALLLVAVLALGLWGGLWLLSRWATRRSGRRVGATVE